MAARPPPPSPLTTAQFAFSVGGTHTDVSVTPMANAVVVLVTQSGKLGTVVHASKAVGAGEGALAGAAVGVRILVGDRKNQFYTLMARRLLEKVAQGRPRDILLTVMLQKQHHCVESVRAIVGVIEARLGPRKEAEDLGLGGDDDE